jgi:DNA-binding NarL/FixJ family response regulator
LNGGINIMPADSIPASAATATQVRRVALVEDQKDIRERWTRLLETFGDFKCVCACPTGEDALREIPIVRPDVILMDIFLPRMSGIECTAKLKELMPETRILILTASDDEEMVFPALEAGADGYLLKQARPEDLREGLLDVLQGGVPITSGIARRIAAYFRDRAKQRDELVRLSAREKEVLVLLSGGYSNKEIAEKLGLSVETIHGYLKRVYEKMHVRSRAEAVAKYMASKAP